MYLQSPHRSDLDLVGPQIMGVLNLTPDSFSDGGAHGGRIESAVEGGLAMADQGASIIDVGGESTRPGAERISGEDQNTRVLPVIARLRQALDERGRHEVWISIDTTLADVAGPALDRGASMINDVSAGREDPAVLTLVAERTVPIVLMHMLGKPATMQKAPTYDPAKGGVVGEVFNFLAQRANQAQRHGINHDHMVLDPGIGFGKSVEHNLALMRALPRLVDMGYPTMVGASRKRTIAALSPATEVEGDPAERLGGSVALTAWAVNAGVQLHRVHDVRAHRQAADVTFALRASDDPRS